MTSTVVVFFCPSTRGKAPQGKVGIAVGQCKQGDTSAEGGGRAPQGGDGMQRGWGGEAVGRGRSQVRRRCKAGTTRCHEAGCSAAGGFQNGATTHAGRPTASRPRRPRRQAGRQTCSVQPARSNTGGEWGRSGDVDGDDELARMRGPPGTSGKHAQPADEQLWHHNVHHQRGDNRSSSIRTITATRGADNRHGVRALRRGQTCRRGQRQQLPSPPSPRARTLSGGRPCPCKSGP